MCVHTRSRTKRAWAHSTGTGGAAEVSFAATTASRHARTACACSSADRPQAVSARACAQAQQSTDAGALYPAQPRTCQPRPQMPATPPSLPPAVPTPSHASSQAHRQTHAMARAAAARTVAKHGDAKGRLAGGGEVCAYCRRQQIRVHHGCGRALVVRPQQDPCLPAPGKRRPSQPAAHMLAQALACTHAHMHALARTVGHRQVLQEEALEVRAGGKHRQPPARGGRAGCKRAQRAAQGHLTPAGIVHGHSLAGLRRVAWSRRRVVIRGGAARHPHLNVHIPPPERVPDTVACTEDAARHRCRTRDGRAGGTSPAHRRGQPCPYLGPPRGSGCGGRRSTCARLTPQSRQCLLINMGATGSHHLGREVGGRVGGCTHNTAQHLVV
jgi:hypothetical protein